MGRGNGGEVAEAQEGSGRCKGFEAGASCAHVYQNMCWRTEHTLRFGGWGGLCTRVPAHVLEDRAHAKAWRLGWAVHMHTGQSMPPGS